MPLQIHAVVQYPQYINDILLRYLTYPEQHKVPSLSPFARNMQCMVVGTNFVASPNTHYSPNTFAVNPDKCFLKSTEESKPSYAPALMSEIPSRAAFFNALSLNLIFGLAKFDQT
jgi:hypothetical protein